MGPDHTTPAQEHPRVRRIKNQIAEAGYGTWFYEVRLLYVLGPRRGWRFDVGALGRPGRARGQDAPVLDDGQRVPPTGREGHLRGGHRMISRRGVQPTGSGPRRDARSRSA